MAETQKQEKEERIDLKIGVPVSVGVGLAGNLFGDAEEAIPTPGFSPQPQGGSAPGQGGGFQFGGGEEEDMYASMMEGMGEPPPGVDPEQLKQMVSQAASEGQQMRAQAETQRAEAPAPGQGDWEPSRREAYEAQMADQPPLTSKAEFREGRGKESPSWWKKLVYGLTAGVAGETDYSFEHKLNRAYQEHIAPQMRAREEQARKAGVMEEFAGGKMADIGELIGMEPGELMVPESQMGSFSGLIKDFNAQKATGSINLSQWLEGAPNVDLPPDIATKMIPLLTAVMKDEEVTSWPEFVKRFPEEAQEWESFKSGLKQAENAAKSTADKQKAVDLQAKMSNLTNNPEQLGSYLSRLGEDIPSSGNLDADMDAIFGAETGGDPEAQLAAAKASTVSEFGGNYVWQVASLAPEHKEWATNYLKREGLAFRVGGGPVKKYKGTYRSIREGIRRDQVKVNAPKVVVSEEDVDSYSEAAKISKVEARNTLKPTAKEQREAKKDFNDAQKLKYDEFMWYHFPDEHLATLRARKESKEYIAKVTKRTQRDELIGGGVIEKAGATQATDVDIAEYADRLGITEEEARAAFEDDPDIRIIGG